jgi:hypothetical protein
MRRVIGMDLHRTFAEVVFWEDGKLCPTGRVSMTRAGLEGVPSRFVLEFVWRGLRLNKILDQAARSTGFSANLFVRVCHPSTLRIVI